MTNDANADDCVDCKSYIDFGTPNSAVIGSNSIVWLPIVENDNGWTNYITGLKWGGE